MAMSEAAPRHPITTRPLVYAHPGADGLPVRRDVEYRTGDGGALTFDLYYPREPAGAAPFPALVFANGFPDPGCQRHLGCRQKEMQCYVDWARLAAAAGVAAVLYANREPVADARAVLDHLGRHAEALGIDAGRIGIWACSGHGPLALSLLMDGARQPPPRCAALFYPMLLDLDGTTAIADAAGRFGFANPAAGRSPDELPSALPLWVARAGQDENPGLNEALDRFAAQALARNLPLTLVNLPAAPHAFDLLDASDASRHAVTQALAFLRHHLGV